MSTTEQFDFIELLNLAKEYLFKFGGPILISIGTVSCLLSLLIFTKNNLRKNPCSIYLVAYNATNLVYIYTSLLATTLSTGYHIDLSLYHMVICKLSIYNSLLVDVLSPCYLILASIDRILITSPNALMRRRSTQRLAYQCILGGSLFWVIFHSYALVFVNIIQFTPNYYSCYFDSSTVLIFIGYYGLVIKGVLIPSLMAICGLRTVYNIRSVRRVNMANGSTVTGPVTMGNLSSVHSKDRQMILILLVDISIYLIFSLMIIVMAMYEQITQFEQKSFTQIQIELFVRYISIFSLAIPFCTVCYSNLLVSKTFRNGIKTILLCK
jgi:hypothetical protein